MSVIDCACVFDAAGHLVTYCSCAGPRRAPVYVRPHVELRGPGERLPAWSCQCKDPFTERPLLKSKRHQHEWECADQDDVDAFIARTGCGKRVARAMLWMERNFAR